MDHTSEHGLTLNCGQQSTGLPPKQTQKITGTKDRNIHRLIFLHSRKNPIAEPGIEPETH